MAAVGPSYLGDHKAGDTIQFSFTTQVADVPTALTAGSTVVYKNASTTGSAAGVTLTASFASLTGLNHIAITTASDSTFYAVGNDYAVVIGAGSTGAVNVAGTCVGSFSLRNRAADLRYVNGGSTGSNAGKLELSQLKVTATGSDIGVHVTSVDGIAFQVDASNNTAIQGNGGNGDGLNFTSVSGGYGLEIQSDATALAALHINTDAEGWAGVEIFGGPGGSSFVGAPALYMKGGAASAANFAGAAVQAQGGDGTSAQVPGRAVEMFSGLKHASGNGPDSVLYLTGQAYADGAYVNAGGGNPHAINAIAGGTGQSISAAVEGSIDLIDTLKLANAANAGKISGGATATEKIRDVNDTVDRITATVDSSGNRTAITLDLS